MSIEWDEAKLSTGLRDIDAQHKEWIRRFNEFDQAVMDGKGTDVIFNTLAFLMQYTEAHFSLEEERMAACSCPALADNRHAHAAFRLRLDELLSYLKKEQPTTVEVVSLKQELEEWVTNHICTIDIKLRGCL
jgi:hemerythrin